MTINRIAMCIDDKRHRRFLVVQLNSAQESLDISIPDSRGIIGIEMAGYQFIGVPVVAGVPYSPAFYVGFIDCNTPTEMLASNNGTPLAAITGVPCQLEAAFTNQQYDTPRLMGVRMSSVPGLPSNMRLNVTVRDETGGLAVFSYGRIYCNIVYDRLTAIDLSASVTRNTRALAYGPPGTLYE